MTVVRIPSVLRAEVGGLRDVTVDGGTVREALRELVAEYPALEGRLFSGDEAPSVRPEPPLVERLYARSERLLKLNDEHSRLFRQQFLGQTVQVLIESRKHDRWEGLTDNYLRVELDGLPGEQTRNWQNTLVSARLTQLVEDGVRGAVVGN